MTREEADHLRAGSELDQLIAEKVLGWRFVPVGLLCRIDAPGEQFPALYGSETLARRCVPCFSTRMDDAWRVVTKMRDAGAEFRISTVSNGDYRWAAQFWNCPIGKLSTAYGTDSPEAICKAALGALG
jgi:hypothetical protein